MHLKTDFLQSIMFEPDFFDDETPEEERFFDLEGNEVAVDVAKQDERKGS